MARLFSNHGDGILEEMDESDRPRKKTNFTSALAMLSLNLEEMILKHAASTGTGVLAPIEKARRKVEPETAAGNMNRN
ncbi:MAG: hypothetical protein OXC26_24490 [Albidovulum sp.]|nr:hypothetical protein [Albidovulum sp.]